MSITPGPSTDDPYSSLSPVRLLAATLTAVLLIGLSLIYLFATETPTGTVTGQIFAADSRKPLVNAEVVISPYTPPHANPDMTPLGTHDLGKARGGTLLDALVAGNSGRQSRLVHGGCQQC